MKEPALTRPPKVADAGPGVPEALPRTLQALANQLDPASIDRLWIFPPLIQGRQERGLVAASCFEEPGPGRKRQSRHLITAQYSAQRTGKGLYYRSSMADEGVAPPDRFPGVMAGVVKRAPQPLGHPKVLEIGGSQEAFATVMADFAPQLLEEPVIGSPP